ncbi:SubName: Full=Uncharacterized protein {ECO:0000313/EMBL:CCA74627.1} [Serendipita indica DSM 11827]|nr:SubName: Full=Uncharacterized protein {ECO:0000313/EMBL:CCA74627.1} [Serendipita indica DSM 11827]
MPKYQEASRLKAASQYTTTKANTPSRDVSPPPYSTSIQETSVTPTGRPLPSPPPNLQVLRTRRGPRRIDPMDELASPWSELVVMQGPMFGNLERLYAHIVLVCHSMRTPSKNSNLPLQNNISDDPVKVKAKNGPGALGPQRAADYGCNFKALRHPGQEWEAERGRRRLVAHCPSSISQVTPGVSHSPHLARCVGASQDNAASEP